MSIAPVGLTGKEAVEHHASQTEPNANDAMGGMIIPETSFTSYVSRRSPRLCCLPTVTLDRKTEISEEKSLRCAVLRKSTEAGGVEQKRIYARNLARLKGSREAASPVLT